jgi:hypothetical protein
MIDEAEANAAEPAEAPEQILIDPFIGEKIHYRFEVQTERLNGDQMTKSLDAPGGSPECHWITRLHVEVQQFGMPSFKQAVGGPGIQMRKQLDPFRAVAQKYRQRDTVPAGIGGSLRRPPCYPFASLRASDALLRTKLDSG